VHLFGAELIVVNFSNVKFDRKSNLKPELIIHKSNAGVMGKPLVTYFPFHGRKGVICLALEAADIQYNVREIERSNWPDFKKEKSLTEELPFGQMPIYTTTKGRKIAGTNTILRHIGRRYNLYGVKDNDIDSIEMILEGVDDMLSKYFAYLLSHSPDASNYDDDITEDIVSDRFRKEVIFEGGQTGGAHFAYLARLIRRNEYLVKNRLSIADVALVNLLFLLQRVPAINHILEQLYQNALDYYDFVMTNNKRMQKYIETVVGHNKVSPLDIG